MQETLHFWTTGEWVTPFARQLFYEEHKEWSYIEKLLLYCMAGTDTPEEILKQYGIDLLAGRRCLIGNTKHGTYALVEDKEHPELEKAKGLGGYPIIKEEMTDLSWIIKPNFYENTDNGGGTSYSKISENGRVFLFVVVVTRASAIDGISFTTDTNGIAFELLKNEFTLQDAYGNSSAKGIMTVVRFTGPIQQYIISWSTGQNLKATVKVVQLV